MRKSILAISALSFMSITQASYTIIIPMEQSRGGSLPNGSINITSKTQTTPIEEESLTCLFNQNNSWMSGASAGDSNFSTDMSMVWINGLSQIVGGYDTTKFTLNGITYTRGTTIKYIADNGPELPPYYWYEVCM